MVNASDIEEIYSNPHGCEAPKCFIGSYHPVAKAGQDGNFYVNTYLLQPNRRMEVVGPVPVRSSDFFK